MLNHRVKPREITCLSQKDRPPPRLVDPSRGSFVCNTAVLRLRKLREVDRSGEVGSQWAFKRSWKMVGGNFGGIICSKQVQTILQITIY